MYKYLLNTHVCLLLNLHNIYTVIHSNTKYIKLLKKYYLYQLSTTFIYDLHTVLT